MGSIVANSTLFYRAVMTAGDQFRADLAAAMQLASMAERIPGPDLSLLPPGLKFTESENAEWRELLDALIKTLGDAASSVQNGDLGGREATIEVPSGVVGEAFNRYFYEVIDRIKMPSSVTLVQRSVLTLLVSSFESLVAKIVEAMLRAKGDLLPNNEAVLSLSQIEEFAKIEDARSFLVERKVDDFMRKSLKDWCAWFAKSNIEWPSLTDDWGALVEVLARRNIFMHAEGRASRQYIELTKWAGVSDSLLPPVGTEIELSMEYLHTAHSRLFAMGVLLCGSTVLQLEKTAADSAISWLLNVARRGADRGDFLASEIITSIVLKSGKRKNSARVDVEFQAINWLCRFNLNRPGVRAEVEAWDTTVLASKYSHWKHVLLEEDGLTLERLKELIQSGAISRVDVQFGAMYAGLRERLPSASEELYRAQGGNSLSKEEVLQGVEIAASETKNQS